MPSLAVGTTAVALASSTPVQYGTIITPSSLNTGRIYISYLSAVGASPTVTAPTGGTAPNVAATDGMEIVPGQPYFVPKYLVDNAAKIQLIASASAQLVTFQVV